MTSLTIIRRCLAVPGALFLFALPWLGGDPVSAGISLLGSVPGAWLLHRILVQPKGYPPMWYSVMIGAGLGSALLTLLAAMLSARPLGGEVIGNLVGRAVALGFFANGGALALGLFAVRGPTPFDPADLEKKHKEDQ